MDDKGSDETDGYAAAEIDKSEKLEPEKERETLAMDHIHDEGVREYSSVEPNCEDVMEKASGTECDVGASVETSTCLTASPNPSMLETSLSSNTSAAHGVSLVSVPSKQEQRSDSRVVSNLSVSPVLKTPARDGYHWRKYGQKQVKSTKGSRSYYRCTYSDCCAKKIECSNDLGNVIEIVNKGLHSHEPPQRSSFSPREIRAVSAVSPVSQDNTAVKELAIVPSGSARSASTKENICQSLAIVEGKRNCENKAVEEPEPKRRLKKGNSQSSDSVSKHGKKHKVVVHAAGDVGISGDGYRWRKYGQKMVKGKPNPRNYYRCTSAGCLVRKHIETAVENRTAVVITYKGVHNHDMPVPKKRHGPPSLELVAAAAPTSMRTRLDDHVNISTSSQCSVGREGEKQSSDPLDVGGGEKSTPMASLRCLRELSRRVLSINQTRLISSARRLELPVTGITSQNRPLTRDLPWYRSQGRHFSSKTNDTDDESSEGEDEEYEDSAEMEVEREYSPAEKVEAAMEIGYKVMGPLKPSERLFKPYEPVFAVVQIGSHQFKVSNGDSIFTEKLKFCDINDKLVLTKVLLLGSASQTIIGRPILPDATVHAVVEEHALDEKVLIFKKKRRKNYRRTTGHRQELTKLRITDIQGIEKPEPKIVHKPPKAAEQPEAELVA
ncbi:unnamed protein product [Eruca vesicaria subsp. sativa]|uniref:WRKY domain-containing protein n=1 Tax=Eruca vesicaria subsp. sativa TaxID=29727 RepID=A0ABC8KYH3_ERUVS|nr:unnamed protein product [Eruca vesicaria subsp. sativa]